MTIKDFILWLGNYQWWLLLYLLALPAMAFALIAIQGKKDCRESGLCYVYSVLVYMSCIPGTFSAVLTGYAFFIMRGDLLDLNIVVYFLPLISMIVTLVMIRRKNDFRHIPGVQRIWGLMFLMGISFVVAFLLSRLVVFIGFIGRLASLFVIAVVVFAAAVFAWRKLRKG